DVEITRAKGRKVHVLHRFERRADEQLDALAGRTHEQLHYDVVRHFVSVGGQQARGCREHSERQRPNPHLRLAPPYSVADNFRYYRNEEQPRLEWGALTTGRGPWIVGLELRRSPPRAHCSLPVTTPRHLRPRRNRP